MRDPTSVSCRVLTPQRMSRSLGLPDMEAQQLVEYGADVRGALTQITVSGDFDLLEVYVFLPRLQSGLDYAKAE